MKKALTILLVTVFLMSFYATAYAESTTTIPAPQLDEADIARQELEAAWGLHQYPADVGGILNDREFNKLVVLLVNNTAERQMEIRRLVSRPSVLKFYACKYSYDQIKAVHDELNGKRFNSDWAKKNGITMIGIGGYTVDAVRQSSRAPGYGLSGYEQRVIVTAALQADYDRMSKELAAHYDDLVVVKLGGGPIVATDGGAESAQGTAVATGKVNVRSGPGTRYEKLGRLKKGEAARVLSTHGKWAEIAWGDGETAYVSAKYLVRMYGGG